MKSESHRLAPGRIAATALGIVISMMLTACASIPISGPVESADLPEWDQGVVYLQAAGPVKDSGPEEIVRGFLKAQAAGVFDGYQVAKEFLTSSATTTWDPNVRTAVYVSEPILTGDVAPSDPMAPDASSRPIDPSLKQVIRGTVGVSALLDNSGIFTEATTDATLDIGFTLVQIGNQWRINKLDNGTLLSQPNFTSTYRAIALHFPTFDNKYLVPDVRWYPSRNLATYAVSGLLNGPVKWLRDSVSTKIPQGTELAIAAVSVTTEGVAVVELTSEVLATSQSDRAIIRSQFEVTLAEVPQVRSVDFRVDNAELAMPDAAAIATDPPVAAQPYLLVNDRLGNLVGGSVVNVDGGSGTAGLNVTALAQEPADGVFSGNLSVVRSNATSLVAIGPSNRSVGKPDLIYEGQELAAPSIDRYGWIWSATKKNGILAIRPRGQAIYVKWNSPENREIIALRVSHDGARVAVISRRVDDGLPRFQIEVGGIVRDTSGAPSQITAGIVIGAPIVDATQVVWQDEATLAILGRTASVVNPAIQVVPLGGRTESRPAADGTRVIAAARGPRSLLALNDSGTLYSRGTSGETWFAVLEGVGQVAFPG